MVFAATSLPSILRVFLVEGFRVVCVGTPLGPQDWLTRLYPCTHPPIRHMRHR
jgi:hypothetical protein